MILRRMADGIREQNWFTVIIEIFVVVIGIVLGLQVTDWNDSRKDRALERDYLTRIAADLDQSAELFDSMHSLEVGRAEKAGYIFSFIANPADAQARPCDFFQAIMGIGLANYANPLRQTYDEMIASGGLSLVRSNEVKKALCTYYAGFELGEDRRDDSQTILRDYVRKMRSLIPAALGHTFNKTVFVGYVSRPDTEKLRRLICEPHVDDILGMHRAFVADPQIVGFLQSVEGLHLGLGSLYTRLLGTNRQARALIAAELGEEGATPGDTP